MAIAIDKNTGMRDFYADEPSAKEEIKQSVPEEIKQNALPVAIDEKTGLRDFYANEEAAKQQKEKAKVDLLTRAGIKNPLLRFGAGVVLSTPEMILDTAKLAGGISKLTHADPYEEKAKQYIKEKLHLPTVKGAEVSDIPELGSGLSYTAGTFVSPVGLGKLLYKGTKLGYLAGKEGLAALKGVEEAKNITKGMGELQSIATASKEGEFNKILDYFGNKSRVENAEEFGKKVKENYTSLKEALSERYNNIFGKYEGKLYEKADRAKIYHEVMKEVPEDLGIDSEERLSNYLSKKYQMENMLEKAEKAHGMPEIIKSMSDLPEGAAEFHAKFVENPTLKNLFNLDSQLKYDIRSLEKANLRQPLDRAGQSYLQKLKRDQGVINNEFGFHLDKFDPTGELKDEFSALTSDYAKTLIPYEKNPVMREIVRSKGEINPKKIMASMRGITKTNDIETVAAHMGDDFGKHIIMDEIGKIKDLNSEKLVKELSNLETKGLEEYLPEHIADKVNDLDKINFYHGYIDKLHNKIIQKSEDPKAVHDIISKEKLDNESVFKNLMPSHIHSEIESLAQKRAKLSKLTKVAKYTGVGAGVAGAVGAGAKSLIGGKPIIQNIFEAPQGGEGEQ